jgi:hypothetical protein
METDGYVVYRNKISPEEQEFALSCIGDKVDYTQLKRFIDTMFLPKLEINDPIYLKTRLSNNNNSIDAALLHSDVNNYTNEPMSIYTGLVYFDKAEIEVIPGSHLIPNTSFEQRNKDKIILSMNPGDVLVFNARISHRGIYFNQGNRRLLQVFGIFSKEEYQKNGIRFITVDTSFEKRVKKNSLYYIAHYPWLIHCINAMVHWFHYYDLKYVVALMDLPPWEKRGKYINYESSGRVYYTPGLKDDLNITVVFEKTPIVKCHFYLYLLLFLVFFMFLVFLALRFVPP